MSAEVACVMVRLLVVEVVEVEEDEEVEGDASAEEDAGLTVLLIECLVSTVIPPLVLS